jgi:hypothetical protein
VGGHEGDIQLDGITAAADHCIGQTERDKRKRKAREREYKNRDRKEEARDKTRGVSPVSLDGKGKRGGSRSERGTPNEAISREEGEKKKERARKRKRTRQIACHACV